MVSVIAALALVTAPGCKREAWLRQTAGAEDLAKARQSFTTKLTVRGPAPQRYEHEPLPSGVQQVTYASGDLKLKGWLSTAADGPKRYPAVVFLHGGFSFGKDDWTDAAPFTEAGLVLFMQCSAQRMATQGSMKVSMAKSTMLSRLGAMWLLYQMLITKTSSWLVTASGRSWPVWWP